MPPTSHPPPTRRSFVAVSPAATFLLFLLLPILLPSTVAQPASAPPDDEVSSSTQLYGPFNSSVGIVAVVIIIFLLSVCSASLLHCSPSREGSTGRAVHLLRRLAGPRGLDPAIIETFPTVVYFAVKGHKIGETSLTCAVCLNDYEDDDVLRLMPKCDHAFHPDCIGAWLASHTTCPVCRADLASQRAGDWKSQQAESGTEPPRVEVTIEATPPYSGAPERRQREREREGIQPPDLGDKENQSGGLNNRNRTRGSSMMWRFSRSHSTGHSLIRPGEDNERFTLRLPAEVRKQLMDRPRPVLPLEDCSRRGYRFGDDWSSRGRYFRRPDRLDWAAKSERWAFNRMQLLSARVSSALSPGVAPDSGGGSSPGAVQQARPII